MRPEFGNDYSKIQVMGNMATQLVLIIQKPPKPNNNPSLVMTRQLLLKANYADNLRRMHAYRTSEAEIKAVLKSQKAAINKLHVEPIKRSYKATISKNGRKTIYVGFINRSQIPLFGLYNRLADSKPVLLATDVKKDRPSKFRGPDWEANNRVGSQLWVRSIKGYQPANYIKPGNRFWFMVTLDAQKVTKGTYKEVFSIVQESVGWAADSQVTISINVI
jgi:hypothetical protein